MVRRSAGTFTGDGGHIPMQACTIVARNYLPQARVLARSFREHHPDSTFTVLVIDETRAASSSAGDFTVLTLHDLDFPPGEVERMALIYDVLELATAVKPWLLRRLLRSGNDAVLYFDPDIEVFAPLSDLGALARAHSIVLTPHVLKPIPRDGLSPSESNILGVGIYNLGFIAVGPGSEEFLDWWAVRLRRECIVDPANSRFTDQRWIDFVPALFPHHILRDPSCNVAYWNLDQRKFTVAGPNYEVNGRPLRFFHYSGYEPDRPGTLSKFQGNTPRVFLQTEPAVARICDEYRRKLIAEGFEQSKREAYRFGSFGGGFPIDSATRRAYRAALMDFEAGTGPEPPNPFCGATEVEFREWLHQPLASATAVITRYMLGLHEARPDIQAAFPDPLGHDAAGFHEWFANEGRATIESRVSSLPEINPAIPSHLASPRIAALKASESVVGKTIHFGDGGDSERYRLSGWSITERRLTWSVGKVAHLGLPLPPQSGPLELRVLMGAFICAPDLKSQRVEVYAGGDKVVDWSVAKRRWYRATIPAATMADGLLLLEFRTPDAASPRKLRRKSKDPRVLGICVSRLRVAQASGLGRVLRAILPKRTSQ